MGILNETPVIALLMCAGISSGPQSSCQYNFCPSGTSRLKQFFISVRTVGSQFSIKINPADVCLNKILHNPTSICFNSGPISLSISSVTRQHPCDLGLSCISFWNHTDICYDLAQCIQYLYNNSDIDLNKGRSQMDYDKMLEEILAERPLPQSVVRSLLKKVQEILVSQSNLLRLEAPICVVGDVHGQFYDVLKLFKLAGEMETTDVRYLFIGDYVDRGYNSLQTILYLFLMKVKYPSRIYLTRGNHESRQISCMYGFQDEVNKKYGHTSVWRMCNQTFDYLPLAAVINDQIFCVHGGLSPDIHALDQIREINRIIEVPTQGPFADLMWSDPEQIETWTQGHRGAGWLFGHRVVTEFNHHNGLKLIARAHQLAQEGYVEWFSKKNLVTVWSAPNYCYRCNNLASYMKVDSEVNYTFVTYEQDPKSRASTDYKLIIPYFL